MQFIKRIIVIGLLNGTYYSRRIYSQLPRTVQKIIVRVIVKTKLYHIKNYLRPFAQLGYNQLPTLSNDHSLKDISQITIKYPIIPKQVAIHCHIFYIDLIEEFYSHLAKIPFKTDIFISVPKQEYVLQCEQTFAKLENIEKLVIQVVMNRGRDIAPMFVAFGKELKNYQFLCHIQSKKSTYNHGATGGWREYLLQNLLGTTENIQRIFSLFAADNKLGIIYPQMFHLLPYAAGTWLSNRALGARLCARMGLTFPDDYFFYPTGSMFWARVDALRPLFDLELRWDDFPVECGQTDGTLAHALERLLGVVPSATGFNHYIIKDQEHISSFPYRFDTQYLGRKHFFYNNALNNPMIKIIAFDIFDTLLVRPLLNAEHTKKIVASRLQGKAKTAFLTYRHIAENNARHKKGQDVRVEEIYAELAALSGLSTETTNSIRHIEEQIELITVSARAEVIRLFNKAKATNKRVILISDMFLKKETIGMMLSQQGIHGWDQLYLSSELGLRKDQSTLYEHVLKTERISGAQMLMIGDNEHADLQRPTDDYGIRSLHILRSKSLALSLPNYQYYCSQIATSQDLNQELTFALIVRKNLNKIAEFNENDLNLFSNDPKQLGFNVLGPLILSFCHWLLTQAKANHIKHLYFLSREGKLLKQVYDTWVGSSIDAPQSHYLQISRRAVNVPNIYTFEDIKRIATRDFFANSLHLFLEERFGLKLSESEWQFIYTQGLWQKDQLLIIHQNNLEMIEPLLKYLFPKLLMHAEEERQALFVYLNSCNFLHTAPKAVVDVGYSGTIQKSLQRLIDEPVHGYYLATAHNISENMHTSCFAKGCFVDKNRPLYGSASILKNSFYLEKLLSAHDRQLIKYTLDYQNKAQAHYKSLSIQESFQKVIRDQLQAGCMDYVKQALQIRDCIFSDFTPSLVIANQLFKDYVDYNTTQEHSFLKKLVLDDDYCGLGIT